MRRASRHGLLHGQRCFGVPLAVIFAALLLGERPSLVDWLGVASTALGVSLAALPTG